MSLSAHKTVYLSGPMSGIPLFNRPAFDAAAAQLRSEGHTVLNPHDWEHEAKRPTPVNPVIRRWRHKDGVVIWEWDGREGWWNPGYSGELSDSEYTPANFVDDPNFTEITEGVEDAASSLSGTCSVRAATGPDDPNPVVSDEEWVRYLRRDVEMIASRADAIVIIPNWGTSRGAWFELLVAQGLSIPVFDYDTREVIPMARWRTSVLHDAFSLTERGGDRHSAYGHPLDDFSRTATLWSAILGISVTPEHIPLCMMALKLSRECHTHKRDNLVDLAGYANTLMMVHEERQRRLNASIPQPQNVNGPSEVPNASA